MLGELACRLYPLPDARDLMLPGITLCGPWWDSRWLGNYPYLELAGFNYSLNESGLGIEGQMDIPAPMWYEPVTPVFELPEEFAALDLGTIA